MRRALVAAAILFLVASCGAGMQAPAAPANAEEMAQGTTTLAASSVDAIPPSDPTHDGVPPDDTVDDSAPPEPLDRVTMQTAEGIVPYGSAVPNGIWKFGNDQAGVIRVCWEHEAMAFPNERRWVQEAVIASWQQNSGLMFEGWIECPSVQATQTLVRIGLVDDKRGPRVQSQNGRPLIGRVIAGVPRGLLLNFRFIRTVALWRADPRGWPFDDCTLAANREMCIRAVAIHEFGHVIGLAHENYHTDAPSACAHVFTGRAEDRPQNVTGYDANSVMNYCRQDRMRTLSLSPVDISTVQALYCRRGLTQCQTHHFTPVVQ